MDNEGFQVVRRRKGPSPEDKQCRIPQNEQMGSRQEENHEDVQIMDIEGNENDHGIGGGTPPNYAGANSKKPFKYFKMWESAPHYKERVKKAWETHILGTPMYKLVKRLKVVKEDLKKLNKEGFFPETKAKCHWFRDGDDNTKLFHNSIRKRRLQSNIYTIKNSQGVLGDSSVDVIEAFMEFYNQLLGGKCMREVMSIRDNGSRAQTDRTAAT
ncbi:FH protein interacting protein FIP2 [Bienertia sinuspersici]